MASANRPADVRETVAESGGLDAESLATKVLLVELVGASRPLSTGELRDRTALSASTVREGLVTLAEAGLCEAVATPDDRPSRYRLVSDGLPRADEA